MEQSVKKCPSTEGIATWWHSSTAEDRGRGEDKEDPVDASRTQAQCRGTVWTQQIWDLQSRLELEGFSVLSACTHYAVTRSHH